MLQLGRWDCENKLAPTTWESRGSGIAESESESERTGFLNFMQKIFKWMPEERATAWELLEDKWLVKDDLPPEEEEEGSSSVI